jgi:hypothetical protein
MATRLLQWNVRQSIDLMVSGPQNNRIHNHRDLEAMDQWVSVYDSLSAREFTHPLKPLSSTIGSGPAKYGMARTYAVYESTTQTCASASTRLDGLFGFRVFDGEGRGNIPRNLTEFWRTAGAAQRRGTTKPVYLCTYTVTPTLP